MIFIHGSNNCSNYNPLLVSSISDSVEGARTRQPHEKISHSSEKGTLKGLGSTRWTILSDKDFFLYFTQYLYNPVELLLLHANKDVKDSHFTLMFCFSSDSFICYTDITFCIA